MRLSLKVLGFLWIGLFIIIGILLFNAYSKLRPDTFIALIREQVQRNYPGSKLEVGNISYRFSLDFNLNLKGIHLRRNEKLLASVGEVELKVPWWLLLANHGNAQINLTDLDIYIDHDLGAVPAPSSQVSKVSARPDTVKVTLPKYLADANFTLRAKHISIRDINSARNYFVVSKLLVREFQYGKNSAFELNIPISIKHKGSQYSSDLWLFGDVTPETQLWKLNYRGEFRTREASDKFQIEDLNIGGTASFSPSILKIESDLILDIDRRPVGSGRLSVDQERLLFSLNLNKIPFSYFGFIYEEIKNPYLVNPNEEASGKIKLEKSFESSAIKIAGELDFPGNFVLSEKDVITGQWKVKFDDTLWIVSFISPKGEASFFRRSLFDYKKGRVVQFSEELGFSGLDLSLTILPLKSVSQFLGDKDEEYFSTTVSYKKCLLGDQTLDGEFRLGYSPDQKFYQGNLTNTTSSFDISYSDKTTHGFTANFNSFKWHPSYKFLDPFFAASAGVMTGKIEGRWNKTWESGPWLVQLVSDGLTEAKGKLINFLSQTAMLSGEKFPETGKISVNLMSKNNVITVSSLVFGNKPAVKIAGTLSTKQKSYLTLSYPGDKKLKPQRKEILEPYWLQKEE